MAEEDDVVQNIQIEGTDAAASSFDKVAESAAKAFDAIDKSADAAAKSTDKAGASIEQLGRQSDALDKVEQAAKKFGSSVRDVGDNLKDLASQIPSTFAAITKVIGGVVVAMGGLAKAAADVTSAIKEGSIATGVSIKAYQELSFAASQAGSDINKLSRAFNLINSGSAKIEESLRRFGVAARDGGGNLRDADAVFRDFADAIAKIKDPADQTRAAVEVFGRRLGPGLTELLSVGAKGLDEFGETARQLRITFTEAELKVGKDFNDALDRLSRTATAVATRIGLAFGPSLIKVFDALAVKIAELSPLLERAAQIAAGGFDAAIEKLRSSLGDTAVAVTGGTIAVTGMVFALGVLSKILAPVGRLLTAGFTPFLTIGRFVVTLFTTIGSAATVVFNLLRVGFVAAAAAAAGVSAPMLALAAAIGFLGVALLQVNWTQFDQRATSAASTVAALWSGLVQTLVAAWSGLGIAWSTMIQGLVSAWNTFIQVLAQTWETIKAGFASLWTAIQEGVQQAVQQLQSVWSGIVQFFSDLWTSVTAAAQSAWDTVAGIVSTTAQNIISALQPVVDFLRSLWDSIGKLASAVSNFSTGGPVGPRGFARGGPVWGAGTATSDSIWARLSNGEYVHRARAVRYYGLDFMNAINQLKFPKMDLGYALGGLINTINQPIVPRFAGGGLVTSAASTSKAAGSPIVLNIGNDSFDLVARDEQTAERLTRFVIKRRIVSAGRKPAYYGA